MTTANKTSNDDLAVQEHCIDLPGESVQCWIGGGTDKLKVVLRKHRDVIFDIHLGNGRTYTLETTESDFYNVRDKKLVYAARQGKVTFSDGERMHVWVSRGFKGALVLISDGKVLYRVEPNNWDTHQPSENPKEKPAPILVAIGHDRKTISAPPANLTKTGQATLPQRPVTVPLPTNDTGSAHKIAIKNNIAYPIVCVLEGTVKGMPAHLAQYFERGGDHTGLSDIDPNHVATRNWIWGQVAGTRAYIGDNWKWLRASLDGKISKGFRLVKAQVHFVNGKVRFYFSGYTNSNTFFGRGSFGPAHERIMTIFAGAGKTQSIFGSALEGIAGTFKENALLSFVFGSVTSIAEWKEDIHKDGYDLAAALITTTIKAVLASVLVTVAVAAIVWLIMIAFEAAVGIIIIGIITISVGFLMNYGVEALDKVTGRLLTQDPSNTDGSASVIAPWLRNVGESVQKSWHYLMERFPKDYQELQP